MGERASDAVEYLPLSYSQKGLWFLDRLGGGSSEYNTLEVLRLRGKLNVGALEAAIGTVIERHESLRTSFMEMDGDPVQAIHPSFTIVLPVQDLTDVPSDGQSGALRKILKTEADFRFDLSTLPLFSFKLVRLSESEYILVKTIHHIVTDGWSNWVFTKELTTLYEAYQAGEGNPLPVLPLQYGDFSIWQKEWLDSGQLNEGIDYWKTELSGLPEQLPLPTDRPRPERQTFAAGAHKAHLSRTTTARLKEFTHSCHATVFMTLLSAFGLLLSRYSHQDDIAIGTPIANRQDEQLESLIGFFVNMLVMRVKIKDGDSFRTLLERVRNTTLNAYRHQDVPFERIVEELQPERKLNASPIFQVLFAMQNTPWVAPKLLDLEIESVESEELHVGFDLEVHTWEHDGQIWFYWLANRDLFHPWRISQMVDHTLSLLECVLADPNAPLETINFLSDSELARLLSARRNPFATTEPDSFVHTLFEAQVRRSPAAIAVQSEEGTYTYGQLDKRANEIADFLLNAGVQAESRVAVLLNRGREAVACFLGILKSGATYLPLDPDYPLDRTSHIIHDSRPFILLGTKEIDSLPVIPNDCRLCFLEELWADEAPAKPWHLIRKENAAYIIYTSGSSGTPKGAVITHQSLRVAAENWRIAYRLDGRTSAILQLASLGFDVSIGDFVRALCFGKRLVICPREHATSAVDLFGYMKEKQIDALECVPAVARGLLDYVEQYGYSLDFVSLFILGADVVYESDVRRLAAACGVNCQIVNSYGLTECTVDSLFCDSQIDTASSDGAHSQREGDCKTEALRTTYPIGWALAYTDTYVLDSKLQPVPYGVEGELYIAGETIARGYVNNPSMTAQRFLPNPFGPPGGRMYRTGDIVKADRSGTLAFVGRADRQVKIRAFRVELGEIEGALQRLSQVKDAAVVIRKGTIGENCLVAYVVLVGDQANYEIEVKNALATSLPSHMIPSTIVALPILPRNAHGKLNAGGLPIPHLQLTRPYTPPKTLQEEYLCEIFADVLGRESIGVDENFFEIGGHSLLAMRIVSRIRKTMGLEVSIRALFQAPTIARLAAHIKSEDITASTFDLSARPIDIPLSYPQGRFWFLDQLRGESPEYNIVNVTRIRGDLDIPALNMSLATLVTRHEALRTSFHNSDENPIQVIDSALDLHIELDNITAESEAEYVAKIHSVAAAEQSISFDLTAAPLLRLRLLRLDDSDFVLIRTTHHIIWDAWSEGIFRKELSILYDAFVAKSNISLPPLAAQYPDFAVWQRTPLAQKNFETGLEYWKKQLNGMPSQLELGTDHPRPLQQTFGGDTVSMEVPSELFRLLKMRSREGQSTIFMVLLSAFAVLLSRYSGQEDIVVGTPITNRFSELFESTIGCFVNLLPLRMNVNPQDTFFDFLGETRNVCFDAYRYQEVPFERLVEELQPDRNPAVPPIFQVILTMHNAPQGESVFGGLKVEDIEPRESSVRYDMALHVMERSDHLQLVCHYNRDLFREWRMQQFLQEYIVVLETIAREPRRKIADIPLMHDDERHAMLALSRGHHVAPAFTTIHKLFERQVDMTPNATALVADGRRFSYGELDRLSNVIATILIAQGVSCEDVLGLAIHRNAELIICVLGVLKAGAAYLPLDPRLPEARLKLMIEDATCKVILADSRAHSLLPPNTRVVTVRLRDLEVQLRTETITRPSRTASRANAAYVLYTSGSSGIPKAVVVEHRQVLNYLAGVENAVHFAKETNYAMLQPLSVDSSVTMLFVSLTSGGCLHLLDEDIAIDALRLSDYFRAENIGCLKIAPSHLTALQGERQWRSLIPDVLIVGGEESRAVWLSEIADKAPRCSVWNHYGPTETTVGVLMCSFREVEHEAADTAPLGRPLVNTEAYVLDASLQLAPLGVAGELYIAGESLGRGYLRKSALTAERFVANPFRTDGSRMYRTGDLARWREDKHLEFLGRADNQVKIRGFRIELREIESVLLAQSAVREAVVVAQKEPTFGAQLVGYVVSHVGERIDPSQVRNKLSEYLPDYMVPSLIVVLDALPRTNHGKLDRNSLPKASFANERLIRAPQTEEEKVLCALFSEVLRLDQVGVDDNFFQLGGHSLMATRIVNRIRSELGVELRLRDVFYAQSIQSLALAVTVLRTENRSSADRNTSMAHEERYI